MKRKHLESDAGRQVSSPQMLAERMRAVSLAWGARDETVARAELRHLADEASLLSRTSPLFATEVGARQSDYLSKPHQPHSST